MQQLSGGQQDAYRQEMVDSRVRRSDGVVQSAADYSYAHGNGV